MNWDFSLSLIIRILFIGSVHYFGVLNKYNDIKVYFIDNYNT